MNCLSVCLSVSVILFVEPKDCEILMHGFLPFAGIFDIHCLSFIKIMVAKDVNPLFTIPKNFYFITTMHECRIVCLGFGEITKKMQIFTALASAT